MRRKVSTLQPISVHCKSHKICQRERSTDLLDPVLQVKTKITGENKVPLLQLLYKIIWAISRCKDAERRKLIGATQPLLPPEEPNLCNNFISKDPDYLDRFCSNFS